jgi:hypothetical protein
MAWIDGDRMNVTCVKLEFFPFVPAEQFDAARVQGRRADNGIRVKADRRRRAAKSLEVQRIKCIPGNRVEREAAEIGSDLSLILLGRSVVLSVAADLGLGRHTKTRVSQAISKPCIDAGGRTGAEGCVERGEADLGKRKRRNWIIRADC